MSVLPKRPEIIIFAGPNGSGKSTITELLKPPMDYINADEIGIYASGYPLIGAAISKVRCSVRRINNVDSAYIVP